MSFFAPTPIPVLDPYHFPNITAKSVKRDITFLIYGVAIYELVLCLRVYFVVCNRQKMKTAIFRLITVAVFSLAIAIAVMLLLQLNLTRNDMHQALPVYFLNCLNVILLVVSKFGYYTAATLRTRALLGRFPKILYCFYIMLTVSTINNLILLGFLIHLFTIWFNTPGEMFVARLPLILKLSDRYIYQACYTTTFDMIFANALIVSFLYPIFATLEMNIYPAIKAMIKLGDVQKALFSSVSSILAVAFTLGVSDPQLTVASAAVWLIAQDTHFLRLSYFSSFELLKHSTLRTASDKNRTNVAAKKLGAVLPENLVVAADDV